MWYFGWTPETVIPVQKSGVFPTPQGGRQSGKPRLSHYKFVKAAAPLLERSQHPGRCLRDCVTEMHHLVPHCVTQTGLCQFLHDYNVLFCSMLYGCGVAHDLQRTVKKCSLSSQGRNGCICLCSNDHSAL